MNSISVVKLSSIGLTILFLQNRFTNALDVPVMLLVLLALLDAGMKIRTNGQSSPLDQIIALSQAFKSLTVWPFHCAVTAILIWGCQSSREIKPVFTRGNLPKGVVSSSPLKVAGPNNINGAGGQVPTKTFINQQPPPNRPVFPRSPKPNPATADSKAVKVDAKQEGSSVSVPPKKQQRDSIGAAASNELPPAPAAK